MEGLPSKNILSEKPKDLESPRRRRFLKGLLGVGAIAAVGGQPLKELFEETVTPERLNEELETHRETLKTQYGIDIDFSDVQSSEGKSLPLSLAERLDFVKSISEAIALYPKSYIRNSGLKIIQGIKWLALKTGSMEGVEGYFSKNDPERLVINKEDVVNYFMQDKFGWQNKERIVANFHHEFYHQSDPHLHDQKFNDDWDVESSMKGASPGGIVDVSSSRKKGFVSSYGYQAGGKEDRATIAAVLFTDPEKLERLAKDEPSLLNKVEKIKQEYLERSEGVIDETYWKLRKAGETQAAQEYLSLRDKMTLDPESLI